MNIALIPARKGSIRIPHKNLKMVGNKALWRIAVNHGLDSSADLVILSTDFQELYDEYDDTDYRVAESTEIFLVDKRPPEYCTGKGRMSRWICDHIIPKYSLNPEDKICLIQPTYPFITTESINWAFDMCTHKHVASAQTISYVSHRMHKDNERNVDGSNVSFTSPHRKMISWSNPTDQYVFGGVVACTVSNYKHPLAPFAVPSTSRIVPMMEGFDIDTREDLEIARAWSAYIRKNQLIGMIDAVTASRVTQG